jgi:hypothetical protein
MHRCLLYSFAIAWAALCFATSSALAITLHVDYTYDTSQFFGAGNPQGAAAGLKAKAALDAAAGYFSSILTDSFTAITIPAPLHSSISSGVVTWSWQQAFAHPATGLDASAPGSSLPANRYVIYAGARDLPGATAGIGGTGGRTGNLFTVTGTNSFTTSEINQVNATTASFANSIDKRGQASGFARWGGSISFDNSARTWHFDHTTSPTFGATDFYSIAIHELAHSLGFGESSFPSYAWGSQLSGVSFIGPNAMAQNGGNPVPLHSDFAHWAIGKMSVVYGTSIVQEAAMDPDFVNGVRKRFTALDAAAMADIGWSITPPVLSGDYNNNGRVDAADYVVWRNNLNQNVTLPNDTTPGSVVAADYTVWRNNFGAALAGSGSGSTVIDPGSVPEPAATALAFFGAVLASLSRRRRSL